MLRAASEIRRVFLWRVHALWSACRTSVLFLLPVLLFYGYFFGMDVATSAELNPKHERRQWIKPWLVECVKLEQGIEM